MSLFDDLKADQSDLTCDKVIESKALKRELTFKRLTNSQWQMIDLLKGQLVNSVVNKQTKATDTNLTDYVFHLIRWSWKDGDKLALEDDEKYREFCEEWDHFIVNEIATCALKAGGFIQDKLKKKVISKKSTVNTRTKPKN